MAWRWSETNSYVADQDAIVRFDYREGQTRASGPPVKVTDLPSAINHHWTKALTASADGRFLYVGIGSNSNITERGMSAEIDRAMVWEVDAKTGAHRPFATGVRNPTALTIQPQTGQLWAVANERDEIGPDLVPDYLTTLQRRRVLRMALQLLGAKRRPACSAAGSAESRDRGSSRLQLGLTRRGARSILLLAEHGYQVRRRRIRWRAWELESADAGRLQGSLCPL